MNSLQGHHTPGSRDEFRTAPDGCWPLDQADTHFTIPQTAEGWIDLVPVTTDIQ